jgi:hypothetical protein
MSKVMTWCAGLAVAGALAGCGQSSAAVRAAGSWGRAIEVPGLGALNKGADAIDVTGVDFVSCARAGNCVAGGYYRDRHHHDQGFVASEKNGVWGRAIEGVPGPAALNKGGPVVSAVSCARAGNCAAGGSYSDGDGRGQGFVAVERHGRWGRAIEVPGLGALNVRGAADVSAVSCASAGNCAAVGDYDRSRHSGQGFVVSEKNGVWGRAIEVPGLGALNKGGDADVNAVSCGAAGSCAAVGDYAGPGVGQFVATERNGRWGTAIEIPGLGALDKGGGASVFSVSCGAAGSCAAVGDYTDGGQNGQGFVATERNDRWGNAIEIPGLGALNDGNAHVSSVSCASAGNCAAAGTYGEPYGSGFVAVDKNGVWGKTIEVPGLAALNRRYAEATSVSCGSPGNCAVVGDYSDTSGGRTQGYVAVERHGRWGKAITVPGLKDLNKGGGVYISEVSCAPDGSCAAGGSYTDRHHHYQGFVVSRTG